MLFALGEIPGRDLKKNISMVLLDLNLPKISGLEILGRIRAYKSLRKLPVIIVTSSMNEKDFKECDRLVASDYIRKPTSYSEFVKILWRTLTHWIGDTMEANPRN